MYDQNGKITASLVCGILSIVFCETVIISLVLGIVAVVIGNDADVKRQDDGRARAGVICGIIGIVLSAIAIVCVILLFVGVISFAGFYYPHYYSSGVSTVDMSTVDALFSASTLPIR